MITANRNLQLGIIDTLKMMYGLADYCGGCGKQYHGESDWTIELYGSYSRGEDKLYLCPNCQKIYGDKNEENQKEQVKVHNPKNKFWLE
jgi:hypothetical protein